MAELILPEIKPNPTGWGPVEPIKLNTDLPYQQYVKNEAIGKIADFVTVGAAERFRNKQQNQQQYNQFGNLTSDRYAYVHEDDESTFQTVHGQMGGRSGGMPMMGGMQGGGMNNMANKSYRNRLNMQRIRYERERRRWNAVGQANYYQQLAAATAANPLATSTQPGQMGGMQGQGGPGGKGNNKNRRRNVPMNQVGGPGVLLMMPGGARVAANNPAVNQLMRGGNQGGSTNSPNQQGQGNTGNQNSNMQVGGNMQRYQSTNQTGGIIRGGPQREASVVIKEDYMMQEELDFTRLNKLHMSCPDTVEDLLCCGSLEFYNKRYDRVAASKPEPLQPVQRLVHTVNTSADPVMMVKLGHEGDVFITDSIMAALMCCTRSAQSWDIIVSRAGGKLIFEKRNKSNFDFLTVNETASNQVFHEDPNHMNSARSLALEATYINTNFSQQVLFSNEEKYRFEEANPFLEDDEDEQALASVGYRYKRFLLKPNTRVIVRCEQDAVLRSSTNKDEIQFINIKALNEWDSKVTNGLDWRSKLDGQRGAVLAAELKNNAFKLAKWTCSALLAGSDQIRFGFVSRTQPNEQTKHEILGTSIFKPAELAKQINLDMEKCWGIFRCIIDLCAKMPSDKKYLIMKDPNKAALRLYEIPKLEFESDEGEDDEDVEDDESQEENNE